MKINVPGNLFGLKVILEKYVNQIETPLSTPNHPLSRTTPYSKICITYQWVVLYQNEKSDLALAHCAKISINILQILLVVEWNA